MPESFIAEGAVGKVWAGDMFIEGPSPKWQRVIAKFATGKNNGKHLLNEAKVDQALVSHMPTVGASCYGLFQGNDNAHQAGIQHNDLKPFSISIAKSTLSTFIFRRQAITARD